MPATWPGRNGSGARAGRALAAAKPVSPVTGGSLAGQFQGGYLIVRDVTGSGQDRPQCRGGRQGGQFVRRLQHIIKPPGDSMRRALFAVDQPGDERRVAGHLAGQCTHTDAALGHERAQPRGEVHRRSPARTCVDRGVDGHVVNTPTVTSSGQTVTAMYVTHLSTAELVKARDAADYLLGVNARLDPVLLVKLDTLRADLGAAIEDRGPAQLAGQARPQQS